jgi:hypothetical protein
MDVFIIGALDIKCSKLDSGTDKEFKSMGHSWRLRLNILKPFKPLDSQEPDSLLNVSCLVY